jgi:hypothetical protein
MNRIISLFLFIFVANCLTAQYNSPIKNKVTLGRQTTADGLIWRGVAATDTLVRKPSIDTMAYMVLDTTTNIIWHYKKATSNAWLRLNLLPSDTASMLTNYYRSGRTAIIQASDVPTLNQNTTGSAATLTTSRTFQTNLASTSTASFNGSANVTPGVTGTLPVANGGTNTTTLTANKVMVGNGISGVLTPSNLHWNNTNSWLGVGLSNPGVPLHVRMGNDNNLGIQGPVILTTGVTFNSFNDALNTGRPMEFRATQYLYSTGKVGYGVTSPTALLHIAAGTATASTAPLKFTSGTNLTTAEAGAMEFSLFNGANRLFITPESGVRKEIGYADLSNVSGTLPVANGGTGSIQFLNQSIPYSNGSILTSNKNKLNFDLSVSRLNVNIDTLSSFGGGASLRVGGGISGVGNYYLENGQQNFRVDGATMWQVGSMLVNGSPFHFQIRNANFGLPIFYAQMTSPRNVGIRTTSLQSGFELTIADSVYVGGRVSAASYTTRSDFNLKDEIQNLNYGLNEIMQLLPVKYKLKSNGENKIGFIAQDVVSVLNEAVHFDENMSIEYSAIIAVLTKAIQEQQVQIEALKQEIIILKNK